jgi:hypothetical protein
MRYASFALLALLCLDTSAFAADFRPDARSVRRHGPAYRYPQAGWIVLHIEGEPYDRGYQHGQLLAPEIAGYLRCFAAIQNSKAPAEGWKTTRTLVNALFLRRFDREFLEEMKGIADGAAAAGGKFDGRAIDLTDIAALNLWAELETLDAALEATPTGLEGIRFKHDQPREAPPARPMHCSAFAATGPATADGKIVFGHNTMFDLYPSGFYNVWLDIKPSKGHRVLMQTYPGGIQSGLDYYMNDAGILISETTIAQTRFNDRGQTLASRIRRAIQYSDTIDRAVEILLKDNNGLYTNEWLLADVKTNEIAMFELGTTTSKLYRSSKGEWFGGTEGFYWGCNNAKDQQVRLDTVASPEGKPANLVWKASDRDKTWLKLYERHRGKIDESFGKVAYGTAPLVSSITCDAKFTTTALAKELKTWGLFGPPLGKTWQPTDDEKQKYPEIKPLVGNPWALLHTTPPAKEKADGPKIVDLPEKIADAESKEKKDERESLLRTEDRTATEPAWHGTLLPKTDADVWLAAAFSDYEKIVALEKSLKKQADDGKLTAADKDRLAVELYVHRSNYLAAVRIKSDVPLSKTRSDLRSDEWYRLASGKGVLLLHALRRNIGETDFDALMETFGKKHAGKEVTTAEFRAHVEQAGGKKVEGFFDAWLNETGLPSASTKVAGSVYSVLSFHAEPEETLIVCGTGDERNTNRAAAEALQEAIRTRWSNLTVPIKTDREVSDDDLKTHHVLLIGRPDSNTLVERFRKALPVEFGSRSFVVREEAYAHAGSGVIAATENPLNKRYSLVVLAGLGGDATTQLPTALLKKDQSAGEVLIVPNGGKAKALVVPAKELALEFAEK